ncbi:hypothetical protein HC928_17865 [bacterium]|nr:hypothetical protein [bacterium]
MTKYILRRVLQSIPLLILITVFVFILLKSAGDPFALSGARPYRYRSRPRSAAF